MDNYVYMYTWSHNIFFNTSKIVSCHWKQYVVMFRLGHRSVIFRNYCHENCEQDQYMMTSLNGNIFRVTGPLCGEFTGPGEFPTQRPVTQSFDVFFDLRLNKRLSKHSWGWWFETLSWSLWRHHNDWISPRIRSMFNKLDTFFRLLPGKPWISALQQTPKESSHERTNSSRLQSLHYFQWFPDHWTQWLQNLLFVPRIKLPFCVLWLCRNWIYTQTSLVLCESYDYPLPINQPWIIWVNQSHEPTKKYDVNTAEQNTTKTCVYFMVYSLSILTHWGRDKMASIFQTTFSKAFSSKKTYDFRLRFHWNLFLRFELKMF